MNWLLIWCLIMNKKAFTLVEMLISLVVVSILILSIGVISSLGVSSYNQAQKQAFLYEDLSFGFKLIQNRARSSKTISQAPWDDPHGMYNKLIVDDEAFGVYHNVEYGKKELVYLEDNKEDEREVMISLSDGDPINFFATILTNSVTFNLEGTRDRIPFRYSSTILRRAK